MVKEIEQSCGIKHQDTFFGWRVIDVVKYNKELWEVRKEASV